MKISIITFKKTLFVLEIRGIRIKLGGMVLKLYAGKVPLFSSEAIFKTV